MDEYSIELLQIIIEHSEYIQKQLFVIILLLSCLFIYKFLANVWSKNYDKNN